MTISFERKITLGYIINLIVVIAIGFIYWTQIFHATTKLWDWIALALSLLSLGMLTVVYIIIRSQFKAKNEFHMQLLEEKKLFQAIIDNTTNSISVKKLNGEYIMVNKQYRHIFLSDPDYIKSKTDHDILPKEIADQYRNSDLNAAKLVKEIQVEEIIEQSDGPHTYLVVKFPLFDVSNRVFAVGSFSTDISERKTTEQSLIAGDAFFKMSMDMLIIASDNSFLKVNPATLKILGYSEKELLGKPFMSFVYPEDIDATLQEVSKLQSGATTLNFENRYICKDGSLKWLNWTTFPDVESGLLFAVARDVSANKEYKNSLKAADCFFEMSVDSLVIASQDKFIKINPALSKTLGYSDSELLNNPFSTYIFPEDLPITQKEIEKLQKGENLINFRNRWICKDDTIKWLSWTATADPTTGTLYAIARDITQQLKLEQEEQVALAQLYESEQRLNLILEKISEGIIVINADKEVVLANNMANELFGTENDTEISINFSDQFELFFPDEKTTFPVQDLPMERALEGVSTDDIDVVLWNPTLQEKKRVLLSGRPIIDHQNQVIAAVITIKDISKYKMMEEELKESRKIIGFKKGKK